MKRVAIFAALLATLLLGEAFGQEFKVGSTVSDFTLSDLKGNTVSFSSLRGPTTVVIFISTRCPISNSFNDRMNDIYEDYSAKGVKFVFINANANESADEVAKHAKSVGFVFPVYKDFNNVVADRFGAQSTPETYVIDHDGVIRYHGYIEDSTNPARVKRHGLKDALDAVLAGQPVATAETKAFGCTIKRVRPTS
ncbi:MAG TPA: redoxin domain-containing protein [Bryobacteraceae bacterium]|nr:redoxin domain-containing protein [Bryobacteraceae bacterium]